MKRLFLFAIIGTIVFVGCKDDKDDDDKIDRIEIVEGEGGTLNMIAGEKIVLHTKTFPENLEPTKYKWTWSSSSSDIVSVSPFGGIAAVYDGEATITVASLNNKTASIHVIVTPIEITDIKFETAKYESFVGSEFQIIPIVLPIDATHKNNLVYSTSDKTVAIVGENGKVETIDVGNCKIIVTSPDDANISATCDLEVKSIKISELIPSADTSASNYFTIKIGESYKVKTPIENAKWESANSSIVAIADDGTFSGVSVGECYIIAVGADGYVKAKFSVKVTN